MIAMTEIMCAQNINQLKPGTAAGQIPMTVSPYFRQAYADPQTVADTITRYMALDTFYNDGDSICFRLFATSPLVCVPAPAGTDTRICDANYVGDTLILYVCSGMTPIDSIKVEIISSGGGGADSLGVIIPSQQLVVGTGTRAPTSYSTLSTAGSNILNTPRTIYLTPYGTTETASLHLGYQRSGDGNALIDFYSASTGTPSTRINRTPGTNAALDITNYGTGNLNFKRNSGTTAFSINGSTGQITANAYTSGTSFAGTDVAVVGHSSAGAFQSMNAADLTTFVGGIDHSILNEIQDLSYTASSRAMGISGGGTGFTFPFFEISSTNPGLVPGSNSIGAGYVLKSNRTWGSVAWSELVSIPAGFADGVDNVNDSDADPSNELQDLSNTFDSPQTFHRATLSNSGNDYFQINEGGSGIISLSSTGTSPAAQSSMTIDVVSGSIAEAYLDATNPAGTGQVLSYAGSGQFTWIDGGGNGIYGVTGNVGGGTVDVTANVALNRALAFDYNSGDDEFTLNSSGLFLRHTLGVTIGDLDAPSDEIKIDGFTGGARIQHESTGPDSRIAMYGTASDGRIDIVAQYGTDVADINITAEDEVTITGGATGGNVTIGSGGSTTISDNAFIGSTSGDRLEIATSSFAASMGHEDHVATTLGSGSGMQFGDNGKVYINAVSGTGTDNVVTINAEDGISLGTSAGVITTNANFGINGVPGAYALYVNGTQFSTSASNFITSDRRTKEDIHPLTDPYQKIMALQPVSYFYNKEHLAMTKGERKLMKGYIAQDYQKIFPEDVTANEKGILAMDQGAVGPYTVAAVQELIKDNEEMRDIIRNQEDRLLALEASLVKPAAIAEEISHEQAKELVRLLKIYIEQQ